MMSQSFAALKTARESMGMTLEEVALRTGVEPQVLEAIEQGDFSRLTDAGQVRGWIRAYARLVKVNPSPLLREYSLWEVRDPVQSVPVEQPMMRTRSRRLRSTRPSWKERFAEILSILPKRWMWAGAAVLAAVIALGLWMAVDEPSADSSPTVAKHPEKTSETKTDGTVLKRPVVMLVKTSESYKYGDLYSIQNADRVVVQVKAVKPTRIRVRGDGPTGEVLMDKSLEAGDMETVEHDEWISLRIDHPDHVQLMVNGVRIDTSDQDEVALYQLKLWEESDEEAASGNG